jgi:hypothetical protein
LKTNTKSKYLKNKKKYDIDTDLDGSRVSKEIALNRLVLYNNLRKNNGFGASIDFDKASNLTFDEIDNIKGIE